ncbi:hypothetical protein L1049_018602 [Liquidambar formosana]|uniref:MULE transposase domain-containing protein n=1 Tax=Liquidambar formosana TaxID=63359 RepID=A0AAP0RAA7_LIQFO
MPRALPVFRRMYVCLEACKRGFVEVCRPIIGIDACHLKGPCGMQLMAAVGRDLNEQMFPIAIAIVEGETRESWEWFLEMLFSDIGLPSSRKWTFISDQQKGLVPALAAIAPTAEHRFCVRHLYGNLAKRYKGKQLKDAMWDATKSSTESEWNSEMNKIKEISKGAYAFLMEKENVEDYVDACYSVKTYMHCYSRMIYPVGSQKFWDETGNPLMQPPSQRRPPGRPKKLRRREADEPQNPFKLRRKNAKIKCSRCQKYGHNKTTCKGEVARKGKLQVRKKAASGNGVPSTQSSGVGSSSRVTNTARKNSTGNTKNATGGTRNGLII